MGDYSRLNQEEWMYRNCRTYFNVPNNREWLLRTEETFYHGTTFQQDSIKKEISDRESQFDFRAPKHYFDTEDE